MPNRPINMDKFFGNSYSFFTGSNQSNPDLSPSIVAPAPSIEIIEQALAPIKKDVNLIKNENQEQNSSIVRVVSSFDNLISASQGIKSATDNLVKLIETDVLERKNIEKQEEIIYQKILQKRRSGRKTPSEVKRKQEENLAGLNLAATGMVTAAAGFLSGTMMEEPKEINSEDSLNLPPGSFPGGKLKIEQLLSLAKQAGFKDEEVPIMAAIALAESSGDSSSLNNDPTTGDLSYGLWQINMIGNLGPERRKALGINSNEELFDPATNARAAKYIRDRQGFGAWSVYREGTYKPYLNKAKEIFNRKQVSSQSQPQAKATLSSSSMLQDNKVASSSSRTSNQIMASAISAEKGKSEESSLETSISQLGMTIESGDSSVKASPTTNIMTSVALSPVEERQIQPNLIPLPMKNPYPSVASISNPNLLESPQNTRDPKNIHALLNINYMGLGDGVLV